MSAEAIPVNLPSLLYERLARRARKAHRSVEAELAEAVAALPDEPDELPALCGRGQALLYCLVAVVSGCKTRLDELSPTINPMDMKVRDAATADMRHFSQRLSLSFDAPAAVVDDGPFLAMDTADFNRDGHLDVVLANNDGAAINTFLGSGHGTLAPAASLPLRGQMRAIRSGDFNGDGNPDAIASQSFQSSVAVLPGNGDGSFGAPKWVDILCFPGNWPNTPMPYSIDVGDLDGDQKLDAAVAVEHNGTVSVLLGKGDGTFRSQTLYALTAVPWGVRLSDLDGDGRLDLIAALSGGNALSIRLGTATEASVSNGRFHSAALPGIWSRPI